MKASKFIVHLQQMVEKYGDLPLALIETSNIGNCNFVAVDIESVYDLEENEQYFDINDNMTNERRVIVID